MAMTNDVCPIILRSAGSSITSLSLDWTPRKMPVDKLWNLVFDGLPKLERFTLLVVLGDDQNAENENLGPSLRESRVLKSLPMKYLQIEAWFSNSKRCPAYLQRLISDIILSTPKLETLVVRNHCVVNATATNKCIHYPTDSGSNFIPSLLLELERSDACTQNLNKMSIRKLTSAELIILVQLADAGILRLQAFAASVRCSVCPGDSPPNQNKTAILFRNFLATQSPTLNQLDVKFSRGYEQTYLIATIEFPRLERLTVLKVNRDEKKQTRIQYGRNVNENGSFASTFPHLQRFCYIYNTGEVFAVSRLFGTWNYSHDMHQLFHGGVTDLCFILGTQGELEMARGDVERDVASPGLCLPDFGTCFPSVSSLEFDDQERLRPQLQLGRLRSVWTTWPALTVLKVNVNMLHGLTLDEWLTGVGGQDQTQALSRELDTLLKPVTLASLELLLQKHKPGPALKDLQLLRVLKIKVGGSALLTDIGGYFGIALASKHLETIVLEAPDMKDVITKECHDFIKSVFQPAAVINLGAQDKKEKNAQTL